MGWKLLKMDSTDEFMQYSFGSNGERKNVKQLYL